MSALPIAGRLVSIAILAATATSCRGRDQVAPTATDAMPRAAAGDSPCIDVRVVPRAAGDHASILEIIVPLDRCRVIPALSEHASSLDALAPAGAVVGVNGGYFDERAKPLGLRRIAGVDRSAAWPGATGGVLALTGDRAYVGPRAALPFAPESAVQSKPLLVEAGGRSGMRSDDGRRAARTTVCDAGDGALRFILFLAEPGDGPTLHEVAEALRAPRSRGGFGCMTALNLDGGPSTGAWFAPGASPRSQLPRGPIVDGLFVIARSPR